MRRALESTYRVETVDNGADALELAKKLQPDVVVSDVYMPEMSGLELLEALKATPDTQNIPIILLTGDMHPHTLVAGLGLGAVDYLRKPIGTEELRARVGAALRQRRTTQKLERSLTELEHTHGKLLETQTQLVQAQKLEAVGRLAAGVAHEINTPLQYVGDNLVFVREGAAALGELLQLYHRLANAALNVPELSEIVTEIDAFTSESDVPFYLEEIPLAIGQSLSGVRTLSEIVQAMKEFSHPGSREKAATDVNRAIKNTLTVARTEWKYYAEMEVDLDPDLPPVPLLVAEFNQVIANLIVNAAHAIVDGCGGEVTEKGVIHISTQCRDGFVEIRIRDSGIGIPPSVSDKVFDPFFTTKEVGRGSGQGLSIARSVVVDKHDGTIDFESTDHGTTFIVRLPLEVKRHRDEAVPDHAELIG